METIAKKLRMEDYFKTHDISFVAEDAVFIDMTSGDETRGKKAIGEMLNYIYHVAFDAHAEVTHTLVTDKHALLEARFSGKHIGEFAGVKPTGKTISVPLCVSYDLNSDGLIQTARIYLLTDVLKQQLAGK